MEVAFAQANVLRAVEGFLRLHRDDPWYFRPFSGQAMCLLAILCWSVVMVKESMIISRFANAIWHLPRDHRKVSSVRVEQNIEDNQIEISFENVGRIRFFLVFVSEQALLSIYLSLDAGGLRPQQMSVICS